MLIIYFYVNVYNFSLQLLMLTTDEHIPWHVVLKIKELTGLNKKKKYIVSELSCNEMQQQQQQI